MRKTQRQAALRERSLRRHQPPDHGVATFAVQDFTGLEILLRARHCVRAPSCRTTGRFAPQADGCNRDADFEPDQVPVISLLPNPTSGMATVQFMPDQSDAVLQIMNSLGQIILERKINAKASKLHKEEIDLSAFPSGVYMIQINTVRKNISRKLIKL